MFFLLFLGLPLAAAALVAVAAPPLIGAATLLALAWAALGWSLEQRRVAEAPVRPDERRR